MRVFVLGIDAFSPQLLRRWVEEGKLPHFARLLDQGVGAPLRSTGEFSSPQAWPSFMTGTNPGKHGIFSFLQRVPGTYDFRHTTSLDIGTPTIFQLLGDAGLRVAHLNIPSTYPVLDVNGLAISGWLAPSLRAEGAVFPADLADDLARRFGPYPFHADVKRHCLKRRYDLALKGALDGIAAKARVGQYLYAKEKWDLFTLVFVESDAIQHYFWHFADPRHPAHDQEEVRRWGNPVLRVYQALDDVLGSLLRQLDGDTVLLVMSDHGGAIYNRGRIYVRSFLERLGLLVTKPQSPRQRALGLSRRCVGRAAEALHGCLPKHLKMRLLDRPLTRSLIEKFFARSFTARNDWSRTRAYSYYWETSPWINVKGREPQGIVEPGAEYEQLRDYLIAELSAATDPTTGQPAVEKVFRRDEMYHGPLLEHMPDLGIWWNRNIPLDGLALENGHGHLEAKAEIGVAGITGGHDPDGVFIALGGPFCKAEGLHPCIEDLAPTILYLLGQPVPRHMDGQPLLQAMDPQHVARHPVHYSPDAVRCEAQAREAYSEGEEKLVEERLRNLGYL